MLFRSLLGLGTPDDTDELITRAKTKKALLDAKAQESADAAAAPPAAAPAAAAPATAAPAAKAGTPPSATFGTNPGASK